MLPGRSILWKYLLLFNTPLATPSSRPPIALLRRSREAYVDLVKQQLRAPDGSFEDWVEIPGVVTPTLTRQSSADNLVSTFCSDLMFLLLQKLNTLIHITIGTKQSSEP